jgi:hypothetical protein
LFSDALNPRALRQEHKSATVAACRWTAYILVSFDLSGLPALIDRGQNIPKSEFVDRRIER